LRRRNHADKASNNLHYRKLHLARGAQTRAKNEAVVSGKDEAGRNV
jgi:hypothetical protein